MTSNTQSLNNAENAETSSAPISRKKPRITWIDSLRGFMMLFVIYGHITLNEDLIDYIYSFHMPIFFLISGMTFRFNREQNSLLFVRKKFGGLMLPYFALSLYVAPLREWLERIGECNSQSWTDLILGTLISNSNSGYKMSSNTNWFIPCLFLTVVLFFFLQKAANRITAHLGVLSGSRLPAADILLSLVVIAVITAANYIGLDEGTSGIWHWRTAIFATGFYLVGYLAMPYIHDVQTWLQGHLPAALFVTAVLFGIGYKLSTMNGYVSMIRNQYDGLISYYSCALATCLAWMIVFMVLSHYDHLRPVQGIFTFVGIKTLPYIAFQVPIMKLLWFYIPVFRIRLEPYTSILTLIIYIGLMPLAYYIDRIIPKHLPALPAKKTN